MQINYISSIKTNTRGYWINRGKLYKDNIVIKSINNDNELKYYLDYLFTVKKQLAVFLFDNSTGYIINADYTCMRLKDKIIIVLTNRDMLKAYIRQLCRDNNGLTVEFNPNNKEYTLTSYYNK